MSEIDISKCQYKGGIECHIRDYPILNCVDVKIEDCHYKQLQQANQKLEKIKPILEHYANSKLGELQLDGTYKFMYATNDFGVQSITYDPRPAKEGLEIIGNYETMDEMDSMQYHIDELEQEVEQLRAELEDSKKQLQEESDLGHKAVQDESDSFMDCLKAEQKLDKIKEVFEKFDHEQRNNPKYHHSNLLLLPESERDKLYLNLFSSMLKNIVSITGYKPIESEE